MSYPFTIPDDQQAFALTPYEPRILERMWALAKFVGHDWPEALPVRNDTPYGNFPGPPGRLQSWTPALIWALAGGYQQTLGRKLNGPMAPERTWDLGGSVNPPRGLTWRFNPDGSVELDLILPWDQVLAIRKAHGSTESLQFVNTTGRVTDKANGPKTILSGTVHADGTAVIVRPTTHSAVAVAGFQRAPVDLSFPLYENFLEHMVGALEIMGVRISAKDLANLNQDLHTVPNPPPKPGPRILGAGTCP